MFPPEISWPPGIIPADAGSTQPMERSLTGSGDHPRGCGEHAMAGGSGLIRLGSSPRMRGAQYMRHIVLTGLRIIPADAGSTITPRWSRKRDRDHPRGCGEHYQAQHLVIEQKGSSPRMRGAPCRY